MTIPARPPRYRAYLLTFWEERGMEPSSPTRWRFTLEDPRTGRRRGFASLDALMEALEEATSGRRADEDGTQVEGSPASE